MNAMAKAIDILGIDQLRRLAEAGLTVVAQEEMDRLRDVVRGLRVLAGEGYATYFYQQNLQREYDEELAVVAYGSMLYELTKRGVWVDRGNLAAEKIFADETIREELEATDRHGPTRTD